MRLLVLIMLLVVAASPPADAHDWYTGLHSPVVSTAAVGRSAGLCPTG